jgi:glycosidase
MTKPAYPLLYQINTRVWLTGLSHLLGRKATLDDIPDSEIDRLADMGFDWIWFLSIWRTGETSQKISRSNPEWRHDFEQTLPDLQEDDIAGSGFAIAGYTVHPGLGGNEALKRLYNRLHKRGLKLMLDFVPNHMGPDHPWVEEHPEYFVPGTGSDFEKNPQNYVRIRNSRGEMILAYGRDPYFSGWPDTVQLDYSNPATIEAMSGELLKISSQCDGVRCDMAMLILPEVFERTWGRIAHPFWPSAIKAVREKVPGFCFMAEVYWDLEWTMLQQGFDYTYDKRLYDRLKEGHAKEVREHFFAGLDYQGKMARFLENHDEPRVAADFPPGMHEAAAVITFLSPGLRFFHQGQFKGRKKRISPHLVRGPEEPTNEELKIFYNKLITILKRTVFRRGEWQQLNCSSAWEGNWSNDSFISFAWSSDDSERIVVAVNYSPDRNQCYLNLPFHDLVNNYWVFHDLLSGISYERDGVTLHEQGLYLDEPGWKTYVFYMDIMKK